MIIIGYIKNYQGEEVFIIQNSFGKNYGDNGLCYMATSNLEKYIKRYGAYNNEDIERNIVEWLIKYT